MMNKIKRTTIWDTETHEFGESHFPSVELGNGFAWVAWHSCDAGTEWLDGHFTVNGEFLQSMDIIPINKPDEHFADMSEWAGRLPELRRLASEAWDTGRVYVDGIDMLIPFDDLTVDDRIAQAISRFRP